MTYFFAFRRPRAAKLLLLVAVGFAASTLSARAADPKHSLEFVPADAHVYLSVSRLGDHVSTIAKSNWWAEVQKNETLRNAWKEIMPITPGKAIEGAEDPIRGGPDKDVPLPPAAQIMLDPANLPMMLLGGEMMADEVFIYTDKRAADMLALSSELTENMYVTYMGIGFMFSTGQFDLFDDSFENKIAEWMLRPVKDNLDTIAIPHVVMGFKIKDQKNAEKVLAQQVDRLREVIGDLALSAPSDKILEETVDGKNCWIWRFNGEGIPWAEVFELHGDVPPAVEPIFAKLRELKGVVTLSVRDGYVLIGVADSPAWLEKLGEGSLLADSADFAPYKELISKPITGVAYASAEIRSAWLFDEPDLRNITKSIKRTLEDSGVDERIVKDVAKGIDAMAEDLRPHLPRPGSTMTVAFTSSEGIEFATTDNSDPIHADGSKPLSILDHVGNAPIAFWAGRNKGMEELYGSLSKTIAGGYALVEKHLFPAMQPDAQAAMTPFFNKMKPIVKKFDRAVRDLWLPALSEGQSALVVQSRNITGPWSEEGSPVADLKLPLPSLVFGVKDTDQLHAGIKEFRSVYNDGVDAFIETVPFAPQVEKLGDPKSREFPEGMIYWHALPKEWGFDKRVAPNYGFGQGFAVFSFVPLDTQEMLGQSKLKLPAPLDKRDAPLSQAAYVDVPRVLETVGAWVVAIDGPYAYRAESVRIEGDDGTIIEEKRIVPEDDGGAQTKDQMKTFKEIMALTKAVPSFTSATKVEGKSTVTHAILRIVDLPK
jgi:hypothetical protein